MLRTNLATRPFYNERAVRAVLAAAGAVLLALTALNALRAVSLSGQERELSARANAARAEADRLRATAQQIRARVDPKELATVAAAAREANDLISQRTFSWVQLLAHLESALPDGVRLTAIDPHAENGAVKISMRVETKSDEALSAFMEALGRDGAFRNVLPGSTSVGDDGLIDAAVEGIYVSTAHQADADSGRAPQTKEAE